MLVATCPCGYESDMLFVGCGMEVYAGIVPALCRHCRKYVTVDPSKPRLRCSTCGRKPEVVDAFLADKDPDALQTFECPACGNATAHFENSGCWD